MLLQNVGWLSAVYMALLTQNIELFTEKAVWLNKICVNEKPFVKFLLNVAVAWLAFLLLIWKGPGSNIGPTQLTALLS